MKLKTLLLAVAANSFAAGVASAAPAIYDFTGAGGNLGKTEIFTSGMSSITAIAINTEEPPTAELDQSGLGLGVRLTRNDGGSIIPPVGPSELDNVGDDEAIVFDAGMVVSFETLTLKDASFFDDYEIYGTNNSAIASIVSGGLSAITSISTLLAAGSGNGIGGTVTINLDPMLATFRYLVATLPGGNGDGFRVSALTASEVPLPGALPFMATALFGYAAAARRRRSVEAV
ncbi:MAG: hypothetical protein GC152_01025 [Alphaproteobacteria bacterium]|nr:hypothetical protein [Alphaproteobacteria bacterium]